MSHSTQNDWVVDSGCTHHMDKDSSLFMRLNKDKDSKIYVVDDFSMDFVGQGDIYFHHGNIFDVYHVPNLSENLLFVDKLTQTGNIVEFWSD